MGKNGDGAHRSRFDRIYFSTRESSTDDSSSCTISIHPTNVTMLGTDPIGITALDNETGDEYELYLSDHFALLANFEISTEEEES